MVRLSTALVGTMVAAALGAGAQELPTPRMHPPTPRPAAAIVSPSRAAEATPTPAPDPAAVARNAVQMVFGWQTEATLQLLDEQRTMLDKDPDFPVVRGLIDAQQGKFDAAIDALRAASAKRSADPAPSFYLGEVLYWQRRIADADQAWTEAAERGRKAVEPFEESERTAGTTPVEDGAAAQRGRLEFYLGAALNRRKEFAAARDHLERALARGFSPVLVNHQIALGYLFEQRWQASREGFDAVIGADELFAPAYYYRAMAWDKLGRKDEMLKDLDRFVTLAPNAPEAGRANALLAAARR